MAKLDWDRVNIENLDYRRKNEIERIEEEKADSLAEPGSHTLHHCPHCGLEVSGSKYRFHIAEVHFLSTGSVRVTMLVARIGSNGLLFSAIPTCVFDDVWKLLQTSFDFDQHYSSDEIGNRLPRETLRFLYERRTIDLSGGVENYVTEIAEIIQVVAEKISWFALGGRIALDLRVAGFDKSFSRALLEELRDRARKAKGTTKGKRSKRKRKSSQLLNSLRLKVQEHK